MKYLLITFLLLLTGCTTTVQISYNEDFHKRLEYENLKKKLEENKEPAEPSTITFDKSKKKYCEVFKLPIFDATPDIPVGEFNKINPKDNHAKIDFLVDYIGTLREYVRTNKRILNLTYTDYLGTCN